MKSKNNSGNAGKIKTLNKVSFLILISFMFTIISSMEASAQEKKPMVRIAKIVADSAQLENYQAALKEGMETAMRVEAGVLRMYAVYEKENPTHVTIPEVYADEDACKVHRETAHFKKHKSTTMNMVKSLELVDVVPIIFVSKQQQ